MDSFGMPRAVKRQEYDELRDEIRRMGPRSPLYRLLKQELSARGWWKRRGRGRPFKGKVSVKGDKSATP